jgi:hypothetical protein
MRARTRHPHLSIIACRLYGVAIRLYPEQFRRTFGHELAVTFRNQLEDVLNTGDGADWLRFAMHIVVDWICTCVTLLTQPALRGPVSLLGLADSDMALGTLNSVTVDVSFVFAVLGIVLAATGWYAFFVILPRAYV